MSSAAPRAAAGTPMTPQHRRGSEFRRQGRRDRRRVLPQAAGDVESINSTATLRRRPGLGPVSACVPDFWFASAPRVLRRAFVDGPEFDAAYESKPSYRAETLSFDDPRDCPYGHGVPTPRGNQAPVTASS